MNKISLMIALCLLDCIASAQESLNYKADLDHQFDNGSAIASIPLNERRTNDLAILGKIWGFVKYYHPAVQNGEYNWDYELYRVLPKIMQCKNDKERNEVLLTWIKQLGEFKTETIKLPPGKKVKIYPDLQWINEVAVLGAPLSAQLNKIRNAKRETTAYYMGIEIDGNPKIKNEKKYENMPYPDAGIRLLALYRYWNLIQYYFPYKYLIGENWNKVLPEFIPSFVNAAGELAYKKAVLALIARIHDTHASIWEVDSTLEATRGMNFAPVLIKFVENKAVVTDYLPNTGLNKGDIITTINGKTVENIIKEELPLTPASNYATQLREIAGQLSRGNDTVMDITYQRGNDIHTKRITCYEVDWEAMVKLSQDKGNQHKRSQDTCFKYITPDIGYIYPGSVKNDYLPAVMPGFMKTKGIIIDFRCYPADNLFHVLPNYLLGEPTPFSRFTRVNPTIPGLFVYDSCSEVGKKNGDRYKGQIVIIVNETTQSSAEYSTMAFRVAPGAKVIGSTTAAADGNVSGFYLPGGIRTGMSGLGVYYPDGRETQRVGIVPDITIRPTIQGIIDGRDELLEKAIEIINAH